MDVTRVPTSRISGLRQGEEFPLYPPSLNPLMPDCCPSIVSEVHRFQDWEVPEHDHADFCLHLQKRGTPSHEWWWEGKNGIEHRREGSLILLPPGTRDRVRWMGPSESLIFSVDPSLVYGLAAEMRPSASPSFLTSWHFEDDAMRLLLAEIGAQTAENWPLGKLYADLLSLSLASLILRRHTAEPVLPRPVRGGMSMRALRACLEYMTDNLDKSVSLEHIAGVAGLSTFHFARVFRKMTNQTPHAYLLSQRMRRAKNLLRTTRVPIAEIGVLTGFGHPAHFAYAFRNLEGVTPTQWRGAC